MRGYLPRGRYGRPGRGRSGLRDRFTGSIANLLTAGDGTATLDADPDRTQATRRRRSAACFLQHKQRVRLPPGSRAYPGALWPVHLQAPEGAGVQLMVPSFAAGN